MAWITRIKQLVSYSYIVYFSTVVAMAPGSKRAAATSTVVRINKEEGGGEEGVVDLLSSANNVTIHIRRRVNSRLVMVVSRTRVSEIRSWVSVRLRIKICPLY